MNKEIEEIIRSLKDLTWLDYKEMNKLLKYITNLQEENKELNDDNIWWNNRFKAVERNYKDYKSRNKKAIEFIKENLTFYITIGGTDERKLIGYNKAFEDLLNILQGSDKE